MATTTVDTAIFGNGACIITLHQDLTLGVVSFVSWVNKGGAGLITVSSALLNTTHVINPNETSSFAFPNALDLTQPFSLGFAWSAT